MPDDKMGMCTVNFALLKVFNLKLSDTQKWCIEETQLFGRLQMMTVIYEPLAATR